MARRRTWRQSHLGLGLAVVRPHGRRVVLGAPVQVDAAGEQAADHDRDERQRGGDRRPSSLDLEGPRDRDEQVVDLRGQLPLSEQRRTIE